MWLRLTVINPTRMKDQRDELINTNCFFRIAPAMAHSGTILEAVGGDVQHVAEGYGQIITWMAHEVGNNEYKRSLTAKAQKPATMVWEPVPLAPSIAPWPQVTAPWPSEQAAAAKKDEGWR